MIKTIFKIKHLNKLKKLVLSSILVLIVISIGFGIKDVYAYYNQKSSFAFLGTTIGDFDLGNGDVNLILYIEDNNGNYNRVENVPLIGYYYNQLKTDCSYENTIVNYDEETNHVTLETDAKTTCKVYFDQLSETDVMTYVLIESDNGKYMYDGNDKKYELVNTVPSIGYEYLNYSCINPDAITEIDYDLNTMKFTYSSSEKNVCYVYYDALSNPDLTLNIYIQESSASETYINVKKIPTINTYVLNSTKSSCKDSDNNILNTNIRYENGNISVDADDIITCNVYLDISN